MVERRARLELALEGGGIRVVELIARSLAAERRGEIAQRTVGTALRPYDVRVGVRVVPAAASACRK